MGVLSWVDSLGLGGLTAAWLYAALSGLIPRSADNGGGFSGRERIAADPRMEFHAWDTPTTDQPKSDHIRWAQDTCYFPLGLKNKSANPLMPVFLQKSL